MYFLLFLQKFKKYCNLKLIRIFFFLFCFYFCFESFAQLKDFNFRFDAVIMDADTAVALSRCHILNITQNRGTVSDEFGFFSITANVGDSIMFSTLGYERFTIVVRDTMYTNDRVIRLTPTAYVLTELDVGLLSTYDRFRRDILSMEAQRAYNMAFTVSRYEIYVPPLPNHGGFNVPLGGGPVTFLYNLWSVEGKQRRQYLSVINGTAEFIKIGEKFNGLLVRELTGFENEELVKFMSFCGFTRTFLLKASNMEIQLEIMRKYREYTGN